MGSAGIDWAGYWWESVTGPRAVISGIISSLQAGQTVLLEIPHDLPWRHEMRRCVERSLGGSLGLGDLVAETIDAEQIRVECEDPGRFLVDRYGLRDGRANFRSGGRKTTQEYLLEKGILSNRIVWIKGLAAEDAERWVGFCSQWNPGSPADGLFVLEVRGGIGASAKRFATVDYDAIVGEYDAQLLYGLMTAAIMPFDGGIEWKRYTAAVAAHLCGPDVEAGELFLDGFDPAEDDPIERMREIARDCRLERRGESDPENNPIAVARTGPDDKLQRRLWSAQMEVLFPLIERERLSIVDALEDRLAPLVDAGTVVQFDEVVGSVREIELGTLVYLMHREPDGSRILDVPDHALRERIHLLRECRNQLAHRKTCPLEQVAAILDGDGRKPLRRLR